MPTHPIGTGVSWPLSFFLIKEMEKKYLPTSKWGSIPRYPSHIVMKVAMCWIPLGFKWCSRPWKNGWGGTVSLRSWKGAKETT